ncbi:MAG: orotate phosphoribosyltransferase [Clostridiales bacterium]|jgi:orotate phosphoribosyltransferase|nr:orotate phosphoribosyltransferase [Clostridiales bacterium]
MLSRDRVEEIFSETGALLEGHFLLTSGRHSGQYMQTAHILQYPRYTEELAQSLAEEFACDGIDVVAGPAIAGIILAYEIARRLNARSLFTERENGVMTLRRGFIIERGERVLVAENVITTGGTVFETLNLIRERGGVAAGVAVLADRSMGTIDFGVKLRAAYTADVKSWEADVCPLCKENAIPLVKPGGRIIPQASEVKA